jgi:hypothetical protein
MVQTSRVYVRESIEKGESADEKIEELTAAVERFLRV